MMAFGTLGAGALAVSTTYLMSTGRRKAASAVAVTAGIASTILAAVQLYSIHHAEAKAQAQQVVPDPIFAEPQPTYLAGVFGRGRGA